MLRLEPTTDLAEVTRIVTHPTIWRWIADDHDGDPKDYEPKVHPQTVYVLAKDADKTLGLLIFSVHTRICWEATIMVLPEGRGRALEISKAVIVWVFEKGCLRLVTRVMKSNRLSLKLNRDAGLKVYGVNRKCLLKDGKLEDCVLFGISKADFVYPDSGQTAETK